MTKGERTRRKIVADAAPVFNTRGYEGSSLNDLMSATGLKKGGIYRHFASKQALVVEAVHECTHIPVVTDTGSLRDDLISCFSGMTKASYEGRLGDMMLSLMDAAQRDPELGRLVRAQADQRRRFATNVLERAVARGELAEDVDIDLLVTLMSGPLVYTKLVRRQRVTEDLVASVVDHVLAGYRRPSTVQR